MLLAVHRDAAGMIESMSTVRRTVTLDERTAAEVERLVPRGGFSRFVNEALEERLRREVLTELVRRDRDEHGPIDPVVAAQLDSDLDALDADDRRG
jgi:Arc/MetJ-type ribon-helix-helix transcriptional regulator